MIEPGKILQQRYRIDKQIGQGGMGAVYVATDERFRSTVAIKETLCMDDNYRKALEREARLLNSLKHAALPRVSDHFIEENGQFLVMEYIPGEDLAAILEQTSRPFPFERVRKWALQLLDALDFLHTQSLPVIHRDIKPQNLKLTSKDQIVLLDFGLAKGNPTDAGFHTAAKSIFGYSRNYASLEQIQGTGTDPRSDLYSLAATLYHLATNRPPDDALTRAMAVLSSQPDPLVPANQINKEIPAGFAGILQRAMDLNANVRPASALVMREMLENMDSFSHFAVPAVATMPNFDPGAQRTKLMPGVTAHGRDGQSAVKTEILPGYISEETALRGLAPHVTDPDKTAAGSRRPLRKLAFSTAGLVLLLCGLAAGAYVLNPSMFSHERDVPAEPEASLPVAETAPAEPQASDPDIVEPPVVAETEPNAAGAKVEPDRGQQSRQSPRTARTAATTANSNAQAAALDESSFDGKTIRVGNIKVYANGKVENPDVMVDMRRRSPTAPVIPRIGPDGLPDPRYLTPAQRQKLQELRRKGLLPPPEKPVQPNTKN